MGSITPPQIPVIDFSITSIESERKTEKWQQLCKIVRQACEEYGCFEVVYDSISPKLRSETFSVIKEMFQLPPETKKKNFNPKPYHGYAGDYPIAPLYESFGIEDVSNFESLKNFAELMWPSGHDHFCQSVSSMVKQLDELNYAILLSILDSYGLGENSDQTMSCKTLLRVMRYTAPPSGKCMEGLQAHTDKLLCTILCEDQVAALEMETKDGQWIPLALSPHSLLFLVGDPLMAWSNGRLHAVKHKVVMKGDKERYSLGTFAVPVDGTIIKAPKELVDEEHPRILKDFNFMDFIKYSYSMEQSTITSEKHVFSFAGY